MGRLTIRTPEIDPDRDRALLYELAEPARALFEVHLDNTRNWYPHEAIPFDMARTFNKANPWHPEEYPLDQAVRSAIYVNLLTEDNLPYYTRTVLDDLPLDHPLQEWGRQWTAEEWRHSAVIRGWVLATRALDPKQLEDARMIQMGVGEVPQPPSFAELIVYTSLQELATHIAHRNTGRRLDKERNGKKVMALVAGDEILHHEFYSGLAAEGFKIDPETMILATLRQLRFRMPGTGIPDFKQHSLSIADAGIYDLNLFLNQVVRPTFAKWNIDGIADYTREMETARIEIAKRLGLIARSVIRQQEFKQILNDIDQ